MAKKTDFHQRWVNGISDFEKEGLADSYSKGRSIDHRSDPRSLTLLPKTIKESGTVIQGLPKCGEIVGTDTYIYDNGGNIYKRTTAGSYSLLRTVSEAHGNGLSYFGEDDYLYYTTDKVIGRYGLINAGTPQFVDDFLGAQGGVRLNTYSLDLEADDSQYGYRADTASLSITGDLTLEAQIKPESVPADTDSQTLIAKWNGSGNLRSYKFDIGTSANYFGDGDDGALTISSNTTNAPTDSACTGTSGAYTLTATNAAFAAGDQILIHQTQGTGAGAWQKNQIQSYTAGTITLVYPLNRTYTTGAQVLVLAEYTNVTVNAGITWTAKAWNGTVGGILAFLASGTVTVNGTITAQGKGFRYGDRPAAGSGNSGKTGESYASSTYNVATRTANYSGGGGGGGNQSGVDYGSSGGGGGYGTSGYGGGLIYSGYGGATAGGVDLTSTLLFGGGGGSGGNSYTGSQGGYGGRGGGIIWAGGVTVTIGAAGSIIASGNQGQVADLGHACGGGGGGAGGSVFIACQVGTLGTSKLITAGGLGGYNTNGFRLDGGAGGYGRLHINYLTSYTGTTTPTLYYTQDNNLGSSDGNIIRLVVSDDGTATETYSKPIVLQTGVWQHVAVTWDASASTATFYLNGISLGTSIGAMTEIDDNTSEFFVGANKNDAGDTANFFDGLIDEVRVFNDIRTNNELLLGMVDHILATTANLQAYYKFNNDANDSHANANHLTLSGSPVYSTDVPFYAPTTRVDIDQSATTASQTYALTTAINEGATHRLSFTPAKDPQKSISVLIAAIGTGNWTLTVHDQYNNEITSKTVTAANLAIGYFEFVFDSVWRPLINSEYHFHLTSTVADGTVTSSGSNDLETVSYRTYYQFLVEDTEWHPIFKYLQFLVIGNERYVGKYEATLYEPHQITLPSGYRVRCFGLWQEYLAIGTMRGDNIYSEDSGRIYFWDGTADTYNFFIDIPEGGINALLGTSEGLYIWAGYQGEMLMYNGGESATTLKSVPEIEEGKYVEIYPQAVTMYKGLVRYGAGVGDSDDIQRGVYTWGKKNNNYYNSLSFDYPISTENYGDTVSIGLVMVVNRKLLIGWQDNVGYGIDYVDADNGPYASGTVEHLIEDNGRAGKEKEALTLVANFKPLVSGESVDVKYELDRSGNWVNLGAVTTADATEARMVIAAEGSRYREIKYAVDLATTTTTSPTLLEVWLEKDLLETEERDG